MTWSPEFIFAVTIAVASLRIRAAGKEILGASCDQPDTEMVGHLGWSISSRHNVSARNVDLVRQRERDCLASAHVGEIAIGGDDPFNTGALPRWQDLDRHAGAEVPARD